MGWSPTIKNKKTKTKAKQNLKLIEKIRITKINNSHELLNNYIFDFVSFQFQRLKTWNLFAWMAQFNPRSTKIGIVPVDKCVSIQ